MIDAYLELLSRQRHGEFAFVPSDVVQKCKAEGHFPETGWLKTTMASKASLELVRVWFAAARLNQQYWTLAVLDVKNKMFLFFDPFDPYHPGTEEKITLEKALKSLFEHIYTSNAGHFQWQNQLFGPQYQSAHESGIAVLMIAYAIVDQMSVEAKFAPNISNNERNNELIQWRQKFARELRPRIEICKSYPAGMPAIPFDKQIHPILHPELPLIPWPPSISDLKRQRDEENTGIEDEAKEKKKRATKQIVRPDLTKWIGRKSDQVSPPPFVRPQLLRSDQATSSLIDIAPIEDYWTIVQKVIAELPKETDNQNQGEEHFVEKDVKYPFLPASPSINWSQLASKGDPSSPSVNSEAMFHRAIAELPPSPRSQKQKGKEPDEKICDEQHPNDSDIMLWDHPPPDFPKSRREPEMTAYDYQTTLIVDFLKTILDKNSWVENFVIDAYLELITRERPQQFGFVPSFVVTHYRESLKETVPSAERELLAPGWLERITEEHVRTASYWLVPAHLNNNHWALAVLDVQENVLTYLDSLNPGVDSPENRAFFRDILLLFNKLFEVKGDTRNGTFVMPRTKWVNRRRNVPRQWNTIDCGVFVLMFAREIVKANSVDAKLSGIVSQTLVPQYRQQIYEALEHRITNTAPLSSAQLLQLQPPSSPLISQTKLTEILEAIKEPRLSETSTLPLEIPKSEKSREKSPKSPEFPEAKSPEIAAPPMSISVDPAKERMSRLQAKSLEWMMSRRSSTLQPEIRKAPRISSKSLKETSTGGEKGPDGQPPIRSFRTTMGQRLRQWQYLETMKAGTEVSALQDYIRDKYHCLYRNTRHMNEMFDHRTYQCTAISSSCRFAVLAKRTDQGQYHLYESDKHTCNRWNKEKQHFDAELQPQPEPVDEKQKAIEKVEQQAAQAASISAPGLPPKSKPPSLSKSPSEARKLYKEWSKVPRGRKEALKLRIRQPSSAIGTGEAKSSHLKENPPEAPTKKSRINSNINITNMPSPPHGQQQPIMISGGNLSDSTDADLLIVPASPADMLLPLHTVPDSPTDSVEAFHKTIREIPPPQSQFRRLTRSQSRLSESSRPGPTAQLASPEPKAQLTDNRNKGKEIQQQSTADDDDDNMAKIADPLSAHFVLVTDRLNTLYENEAKEAKNDEQRQFWREEHENAIGVMWQTWRKIKQEQMTLAEGQKAVVQMLRELKFKDAEIEIILLEHIDDD